MNKTEDTQQDVFFWEQQVYRLRAAQGLPYHLAPSLQSQQATQGWVMLDSTFSKAAGNTCAACPATGTDSWVCEQAQAFRGYTAGQGCADTLVRLSPVSGSTLLSLISISREDVRREVRLISLSKAPCQLGNLCTELGCTNRCTHRDWAFLTPCSQQVFHYAQELLTAEATCLVMWEQSGVLLQFLLQGSYLSMHDAFSHCMCFNRYSTLFLCMIFLREEDPLLVAVYLFISISLNSILGSWKGEEEHNAENSFTTSLYLPRLKILSRWKEFIWK